MHDFARDLMHGIRDAIRRPGYSIAVIATLAIGIGANTAIYSVFNWIMFRPLPGVAEPGRLVTVRYQTPNSSARFFVPYLDYVTLRDEVASFQGLAASLPLGVHLADDVADEGVRVEAEVVTANYFTVLGATPVAGRGFLPSEERTLSSLCPVVISESLWKGRFNGDLSVLGRTVRIDGHPFVIVGVAPSGFRGRSLVNTTDVWAPVGAHMALLPHYGRDTLTTRGNSLFGDAIGRLRPGVSIEQAQAEASNIAEASPDFASRRGRKSSIRPVLYAGVGHDTFAAERLMATFKLLMGAVGLVLLLACANAANLLLGKMASGTREIAVRQAIGASRFRIVRMQLAEGLVLSIASGGAGLILAVWLTSLFEGMQILTFLPALQSVAMDWRVAAFTVIASLATAVLFTTAPAVAGSRVNLTGSLKSSQTSSPRNRRFLRGGLVAVQITLSLILLVGAGLFVRTLQNVRNVDLGIDVTGVAGFLVDPSRIGHNPERSQRMLLDVAERLKAIPGIDAAAVTWTTPFGMARAEMAFATLDAPTKWHDAASTAVSPGYFAVMGIPILAGRDFTESEFGRLNTTDGVVILSRGLAEQIFPNGGALGARLRMQYPENMEVRVVGIAGDVRGRPITSEPEPYAYEPGGQRWPITWGNVVARSGLPAANIAAAAREAMRSVDSAFTPPVIEPFEAAVDRVLAEERLFAKLSSIFAAIAALLAAIGIYGVMASTVIERRKEFGIRLALGAKGTSVAALVLRSALTLTGIGLALGLGGAAALQRVIESRLYGVTGTDPLTIACAAVAIVVVTVIAGLLPAVRATRVDPVRWLRVD